MSWPYDYIIIGAGSAGCAIANRLAENMALRILILEAGPPDTSFKLKMPAGFASLGENSPYNWRYETVPQKHCNDRRMYWPRGKTLGGSSSINAMLYVRGHASDYDHWRQLGNEGWSYREVLPFFKKAERNERYSDEYHGTDGPLNVAEQRHALEINDGFIRACAGLGIPRNDDFNGAEQYGVGYYQVTQREPAALERGQRLSAARGRAQPQQRPRHLQRPGRAHHPRQGPRHGRALRGRRPRRGRALQPRDHPVGRRGELAAAPDAVGHRPGRSPELARHPAAARPAGRRRQPAGPSRRRHPAARQVRDDLRPLEQAVGAVPVPREQEGSRHLADRRIGRLPLHAARPERARRPAALPAGHGRRSRPHRDAQGRLQPARLHAASREPRHDPSQEQAIPRSIR